MDALRFPGSGRLQRDFHCEGHCSGHLDGFTGDHSRLSAEQISPAAHPILFGVWHSRIPCNCCRSVSSEKASITKKKALDVRKFYSRTNCLSCLLVVFVVMNRIPILVLYGPYFLRMSLCGVAVSNAYRVVMSSSCTREFCMCSDV